VQLVGLKIAGFKSFVDPVDVPIEEGLTGIVGPNGCGKSNLLEALRWAMGAASARAMRGGEMDDLIFSGTTERPAREIAEVALVLDNRDRTAPAEFNDEDVLEIRRMLRRAAGSSYRINGRTVRAKDVQLLFADASTGANSPALVRQGQISELINSKPQNRRRILEEAAGIGGLAVRRHEAELKLAAADANLEKLAEIMAEVERQAASLKRQVSKARRYKAFTEEIAAIEIRLGAARWRGAVVETAEARATIETAKKAEQTAVSAVARASTTELEARSAIDPLRAAEADAAGRLGVMKVNLARIEGERDAARETAARLERDIARLGLDAAHERSQGDDAKLRAERAAKDLAALPPEDAAAQAKEEQRLSAAVEDAMSALQTFEAEADARRTAIAQAEARATAATEALAREQQRLARFDADLDKVRTELSTLGDPASLDAPLKAARQRHTEAEQRAQAAQTALAAANEAVDDARAEEARLTPPLHAAERRVVQLEAELKGLERLLRKDETVVHPVLEDIRAPGLERALAAALDADLDAPEDSAAPAHWSGRHGDVAAYLPDGAKSLADLIEAPAALRARLSQCGLVDASKGPQLITSLKLGQRLVSREGDLWRWDGFVRRAEAPLPAAERLAQRTRKSEIERELVTARRDRDAAQAARERASSALTAAEMTAMERRKGAPDAIRAAGAAHEAALRAEQDLERLSLRGQALRESSQRLQVERDAAASNVAAAQTALAAQPTTDDRAILASLAEQVRTARDKERNAAATLDFFIREQERAAATRSSLARDHQDWRDRANASAARLSNIERELTEARTALTIAADLPEKLQARLDAMAGDTSTAEHKRQAAADALAEADGTLRAAEFASRTAREASATARENLVRAEARLEAAIRREAEISETVRAAFDRDLEDLEQLVASVIAKAGSEAQADAAADAHALDMRLAQLRRDRDQLGAVNMEADDQLAEIAGRMGVQEEERQDLIAAIAKLREGVSALNEEGRSRLLEAFEQVNAHFKSLFTTLFEGGSAELRLTESEDPLSAGLEIFAQPPGKRLGQLSLMSGGEQALTATALIFAVFLSRPAPLCVLDEVDAPLDDANVDRFCRMLDEMRKRTNTRFIIITHNAVTMSRMDRLFGVTMQERGVSRLVSVDLEAAERLAAA
jgi:chromosome segregation protein